MDYLKSLENAIIYIENHLGENITVEDVAHNVGYSYYHLTRQFSAILGESVGCYIKRRRLADGAKKLLYTDKRIIDIAIENGFESSEAFSRAFKSLYKVNPSTYRQNRLNLLISNKEKLNSKLIYHRAKNITVSPKIVELPDIQVAGLRGQTTLSDNTIPELWKYFVTISKTIPNKKINARGFGICEACETINAIYNMNDNVLFSEVAGIEVSGFENLTKPFVSKILRKGRYAVFTHRGSLALIQKTFEYIYDTWFLNTKETLDCRDDFELYDNRFLGYDNPKSEIEVYIPIK